MRITAMFMLGSWLWSQSPIPLLYQVPLDGFSQTATEAHGIWGYRDPQGLEYALIATNTGLAVFLISPDAPPQEIGMITDGVVSPKRDVQIYVYDDPYAAWAYVTVKESSPGDGGMQIIDLTDLPNSITEHPRYTGFHTAEGISAGTKPTGYVLFVFGTDTQDSGGGVVALDVSTPNGPYVKGFWDGAYTYDLALGTHWEPDQPPGSGHHDGKHRGIAFCDSTFYVLDLESIYSGGSTISVITSYVSPGGFTGCRSGWVAPDGGYLYVCDHRDETAIRSPTRVWHVDIGLNLWQPVVNPTPAWTGDSEAIDHQAFISGHYLYLATCTQGLNMFHLEDPENLTVDYRHDSYPSSDETILDGAWEVFPFPLSGLVAMSDRSSGLLILDPDVPEDLCRSLDVDQDGFELSEFQAEAAGWPEPVDVTQLVNLVSWCLDSP